MCYVTGGKGGVREIWRSDNAGQGGNGEGGKERLAEEGISSLSRLYYQRPNVRQSHFRRGVISIVCVLRQAVPKIAGTGQSAADICSQQTSDWAGGSDTMLDLDVVIIAGLPTDRHRAAR